MRDQHSLALDKLLTANTRITTLESEIRDLQKEVLKSSHALLAKESQVKSLKDTVLKLGGDESSVICNLRRDFEDQIDGFKQQIQNLQDSLAKEKEFMKEKQHEFQENMNRLRKEKVRTCMEYDSLTSSPTQTNAFLGGNGSSVGKTSAYLSCIQRYRHFNLEILSSRIAPKAYTSRTPHGSATF